MIVAVTGGTGFIGRPLVQHHLGAGDQVRILSRKAPEFPLPTGLEWFQGDLSQRSEGLREFVLGADVVFHGAGELQDETRMEALHVEGTRGLVELASGRIRRWVQLSSVGVYGPGSGGEITEDSPISPRGRYETTKAHADSIVAQAGQEGRFESVILRPSIVFGPEMPNQSLFQLLEAIRKGRFFFIGQPGASANYVAIQNVVHALGLCSSHPAAAGGVFNLSDQGTIDQMVGWAADEMGRPVPQLRISKGLIKLLVGLASPAPGFPLTLRRVEALTNRSSYPTRSIEQSLGYQPMVGFEQSFRSLVRAWAVRRGH